MQGFLSTRTIKPNEKFVFMGNREKVLVEVVETYRLILDTGFYLDLMDTFYMGETYYVIGIEIFRDRSQGMLGLSQKAYINKVLERFRMDKCSTSLVPIQKGDKFSLMQCPKNDWEQKQMENIPYTSIVGSLMYAQTCTRPDISFAVGMLGRYQSNPKLDHWKSAKKILRYLQGTKDHMLTYKRSDHLEVIGYTDSYFAGCVDTRKSTFGYVYLLAGRANGKVRSRQSLLHPPWRLNLWHALRP